ncbi:MAG: hypothetical protein ACPL28_03685 [bacterium]
MINFTNEEKKLIERRRKIIKSSSKINALKLDEQQIGLLALWEPGPEESDKSFKKDLDLIPFE